MQRSVAAAGLGRRPRNVAALVLQTAAVAAFAIVVLVQIASRPDRPGRERIGRSWRRVDDLDRVGRPGHRHHRHLDHPVPVDRRRSRSRRPPASPRRTPAIPSARPETSSWTDLLGESLCSGLAPGTYRLDRTIRSAAVRRRAQDACPARIELLTSTTWHRCGKPPGSPGACPMAAGGQAMKRVPLPRAGSAPFVVAIAALATPSGCGSAGPAADRRAIDRGSGAAPVCRQRVVADVQCPANCVRPSSSSSAASDQLTGTWTTGQVTCVQWKPPRHRRRWASTAAQLKANDQDVNTHTCPATFKIRFQGGRLAIFVNDELGWNGTYKITDDHTFVAGDNWRFLCPVPLHPEGRPALDRRREGRGTRSVPSRITWPSRRGSTRASRSRGRRVDTTRLRLPIVVLDRAILASCGSATPTSPPASGAPATGSPAATRVAAASVVAAFTPTYSLGPCPDEVEVAALVDHSCGRLTVLEDRSKPAGRTIDLLVVQTPTTAADPRSVAGNRVRRRSRNVLCGASRPRAPRERRRTNTSL